MPNKSARALCGFVLVMLLTPFFSHTAHSAPLSQGGPYEGLRRTVLDNGCVLLVLPSHKAGTVAVYLGVRSGSADETRWMGMGLSHFVEHMFFKGTPKRDKGELERQVREMGGYINAYTSHDNTVFHLTALSEYTEAAIDLIYDAAFHPLFDPSELEKERQVILAEQRMNEDRLPRKALQSLWEISFLRHPYRHPIIGYPEIFRKSTREDLTGYYRERYTPNQMVVCVVGDVKPDQVEKWVRDRFGSEPRAVDPSAYREPEPLQASPRRLLVHRPAQHARLEFGFAGVPLMHPDGPALDILAQILGDGASSRLFQQVKEKERLVLEIGASSTNLRDGGLFEIDAVCLPEKAEAARDAILGVVEAFKTDGPTSAEVERAKRLTLARHYQAWETHDSLAHDLITSEIYTGDSRYSEHYIGLIEKIESADVLRVAKRYLNLDRLNQVWLLPESDKASKDVPEAESVRPQPKRFELQNGARVLIIEDPSIPIASFQLSLRGGVSEETEANNGISSLVSELLLRGTRRLDQQGLSDAFADWGGGVNSFAGQHTFGISASVLSAYSGKALELLSEMILDSVFAEEEFEKVREDQLQAVLAEKEDIYQASSRLLGAALYGAHPYGMSVNGTEDSLARLSREQAVDFFKARTAGSRMVIGVAGDVRAEQVLKILNATFGKLPKASTASLPGFPDQPALLSPLRLHEHLKREQAVAMLAFRAVRLDDPRRYAYQVLNAIMSGSAGRLYQHIRGVHGLSYVINSGLSLGLDPGHFAMYAGVGSDEGDRVLGLLVDEAVRLRQHGITEDELVQAQKQLIGNHEQSLESRSSMLQEAVTDEILGLGYEEMNRFADGVRAVQKKDVEAIVREFIDPDRSVGLVVSPPAARTIGTPESKKP